MWLHGERGRKIKILKKACGKQFWRQAQVFFEMRVSGSASGAPDLIKSGVREGPGPGRWGFFEPGLAERRLLSPGWVAPIRQPSQCELLGRCACSG